MTKQIFCVAILSLATAAASSTTEHLSAYSQVCFAYAGVSFDKIKQPDKEERLEKVILGKLSDLKVLKQKNPGLLNCKNDELTLYFDLVYQKTSTSTYHLQIVLEAQANFSVDSIWKYRKSNVKIRSDHLDDDLKSEVLKAVHQFVADWKKAK